MRYSDLFGLLVGSRSEDRGHFGPSWLLGTRSVSRPIDSRFRHFELTMPPLCKTILKLSALRLSIALIHLGISKYPTIPDYTRLSYVLSRPKKYCILAIVRLEKSGDWGSYNALGDLHRGTVEI